MGKPLVVLMVCIMMFSVVGCASFRDIGCDTYVKDFKYWRSRASFYDTGYPECSNSEKAEMLVNEMCKDGANPVVEDRHVDVVTVYVFDECGRQIWPVEY